LSIFLVAPAILWEQISGHHLLFFGTRICFVIVIVVQFLTEGEARRNEREREKVAGGVPGEQEEEEAAEVDRQQEGGKKRENSKAEMIISEVESENCSSSCSRRRSHTARERDVSHSIRHPLMLAHSWSTHTHTTESPKKQSQSLFFSLSSSLSPVPPLAVSRCDNAISSFSVSGACIMPARIMMQKEERRCFIFRLQQQLLLVSY